MSQTRSCQDYALQSVYGAMTPELSREIIAFWSSNHAIGDPIEAERRVAEVVCVARNPEGEIAGVNSVYEGTLGEPPRPYYFYRLFIRKQDRVLGLAGRMRVICSDRLRSEAATSGVLGIALVTENAKLMTVALRRLLHRSGWQYLGREALGRDVWKIDFGSDLSG